MHRCDTQARLSLQRSSPRLPTLCHGCEGACFAVGLVQALELQTAGGQWAFLAGKRCAVQLSQPASQNRTQCASKIPLHHNAPLTHHTRHRCTQVAHELKCGSGVLHSAQQLGLLQQGLPHARQPAAHDEQQSVVLELTGYRYAQKPLRERKEQN